MLHPVLLQPPPGEAILLQGHPMYLIVGYLHGFDGADDFGTDAFVGVFFAEDALAFFHIAGADEDGFGASGLLGSEFCNDFLLFPAVG